MGQPPEEHGPERHPTLMELGRADVFSCCGNNIMAVRGDYRYLRTGYDGVTTDGDV
jgi:hypothetical protein